MSSIYSQFWLNHFLEGSSLWLHHKMLKEKKTLPSRWSEEVRITEQTHVQVIKRMDRVWMNISVIHWSSRISVILTIHPVYATWLKTWISLTEMAQTGFAVRQTPESPFEVLLQVLNEVGPLLSVFFPSILWYCWSGYRPLVYLAKFGNSQNMKVKKNVKHTFII